MFVSFGTNAEMSRKERGVPLAQSDRADELRDRFAMKMAGYIIKTSTWTRASQAFLRPP